MRVVVSCEHRFVGTPDGTIWTDTGYAYSFWERYLCVFEEVHVLARVRQFAAPPDGCVPATGPAVSFARVPYYVGPYQYLQTRRAVAEAAGQAVDREDAVILRVASQLANCLFLGLRRARRPYGVEVVGDPWDVFAPGGVKHPLRPALRWYFTKQVKRQCQEAAAASYVTEHALQRRYPVGRGGYTTSYSSVELSEGAFHRRRPDWAGGRQWGSASPSRLVFSGSLEQRYKALDVLLEALALCTHAGMDWELTVLGEGRHRMSLERQGERLGIRDRVTFRGQVPAGQAVQEAYDRADLFVLPSRTEGLPRAMIEAMARSLPCIGTSVGGIPELLAPEDIVTPDCAVTLSEKLLEVLGNPARLRRMSGRNYQRARDFRDSVLQGRRNELYGFLQEKTRQWAIQTNAARAARRSA